jgi:hypothetical protein
MANKLNIPNTDELIAVITTLLPKIQIYQSTSYELNKKTNTVQALYIEGNIDKMKTHIKGLLAQIDTCMTSLPEGYKIAHGIEPFTTATKHEYNTRYTWVGGVTTCSPQQNLRPAIWTLACLYLIEYLQGNDRQTLIYDALELFEWSSKLKSYSPTDDINAIVMRTRTPPFMNNQMANGMEFLCLAIINLSNGKNLEKIYWAYRYAEAAKTQLIAIDKCNGADVPLLNVVNVLYRYAEEWYKFQLACDYFTDSPDNEALALDEMNAVITTVSSPKTFPIVIPTMVTEMQRSFTEYSKQTSSYTFTGVRLARSYFHAYFSGPVIIPRKTFIPQEKTYDFNNYISTFGKSYF